MDSAALILCASWLGCAVWTDLCQHRIPNWLTVPAAIAGLLISVIQLGAAAGAIFSLNGFATGLGLLFIPFLLGGMGGGDVKLLAALGAWLGPGGVFWAFLYGAIIGGILGLGMVWRKSGLGGVKTVLLGMVLDMRSARKPVPSETGPKLPYALPIALGFGLYAVGGPMG